MHGLCQEGGCVGHAAGSQKFLVLGKVGAQLIVAVGSKDTLEGQGAHVVALACGKENAHFAPPVPWLLAGVKDTLLASRKAAITVEGMAREDCL